MMVDKFYNAKFWILGLIHDTDLESDNTTIEEVPIFS